jgi:mono/diheme cytochrome c family protein
MSPRIPRWLFGVLLGIATVGAGQAFAEENKSPLPQSVKTWLEDDQVQRWSVLLETGKKKFNEGSCAKCHGTGGTGGKWGPDLTDDKWVQTDGSLEQIREVIMWGVRRSDFKDPNRRFEMNPSGGMMLEWDEMRALAAYVWSLNHGSFLPSR